jgi:hypothetical protein
MSDTCDRDLWLSGAWTMLTGATLFISSIFGLVTGRKIYTFTSDET